LIDPAAANKVRLNEELLRARIVGEALDTELDPDHQARGYFVRGRERPALN
jgi:hypothetical protein